MEDLESTLPKPASFEGGGTEMSSAILGDNAYPLKTYLMKAFARKDMSCEEQIFSCRLSQARSGGKNIFVILAEKWRLLNKAIKKNFNEGERIVSFICLLNNIIIYPEGTKHDHFVLQETSQILESRQTKTNVGGRPIRWFS